MPDQLKPDHVVKDIPASDFKKVTFYFETLPINKQLFIDLFWVIRYTGARLGGTVSIRKSDVDLSNWRIELNEKGRGGKKKRRVIPMFPKIRPILLRLCSNLDNDELLFPTYNRAYKNSRKIHDFNVMQKKLNLDWSLHNLRKTIGGELLNVGWSMKQVSVFLGHSSVSITERWYIGSIDLVNSELPDLK